ncbi:MAG: hypothetical protein P4L33_01755 [Capsulimonadaceae bacterium]|nr:hypothetical protein [Capsulimonadaceae bacterium]
MPLTNIILMTLGTWETTNLLNNQEEVAASRLFVHIVCDSERGGIRGGSGMEHYVVPDRDDAAAAAASDDEKFPLFPGRFEADLNIPSGATNPDGTPAYSRNLVVVENTHPVVNQDFTRVWFLSGSGGSVTDDDEVTDQLLELYIELDYPRNIVRGFIRLYKKPLLGGDSELAVTLM